MTLKKINSNKGNTRAGNTIPEHSNGNSSPVFWKDCEQHGFLRTCRWKDLSERTIFARSFVLATSEASGLSQTWDNELRILNRTDQKKFCNWIQNNLFNAIVLIQLGHCNSLLCPCACSVFCNEPRGRKISSCIFYSAWFCFIIIVFFSSHCSFIYLCEFLTFSLQAWSPIIILYPSPVAMMQSSKKYIFLI